MDMSDNLRETIRAAAQTLGRSTHIVAFTGAGISSESGIPTYRGEDGLWNKYDPNIYANIFHFRKDPTYYWDFFREVRYPLLKSVRPNPAHMALAKMEKEGHSLTVVTQNIDGLHQDAGSSSVIELHGTSRKFHCTDCSNEYSMDLAFQMSEETNPPLCSDCEGILRPAVIFFGESLDPHVLQQAYQVGDSCDFLLVVGSSLVVYPAADIPLRAKQGGAVLAIVNKEDTPLDHLADFVIHEEAGRILPRIVEDYLL